MFKIIFHIFPLISILKSKEIFGNFIKQKVMSSADPDSKQGPKDISFSTILRSTNWAIGQLLRSTIFFHQFFYNSPLYQLSYQPLRFFLRRLCDLFSSENLDYDVKKTARNLHQIFSWFYNSPLYQLSYRPLRFFLRRLCDLFSSENLDYDVKKTARNLHQIFSWFGLETGT